MTLDLTRRQWLGAAAAAGVAPRAFAQAVPAARGEGRLVVVFLRGALDGLSIGFRTVRAKRDPATGVRRILEADLWEISVVTFPMLPSARVSNVKNARFYRDKETELVRTLRRATRSMIMTTFKG